jgi:hypothetical protein
MMISAWHLLWIIPLAGSIGALFMALAAAAGKKE